MFDNVGSSIQWSPLLHLSKAVRSKTCQTGTKLVCLAQNTWATATSKKIHDFGRVPFPFFVSRGYQGGSARRVRRRVLVNII